MTVTTNVGDDSSELMELLFLNFAERAPLAVAAVLAGGGLRNPAVYENSEEMADGQTEYGDSNGR